MGFLLDYMRLVLFAGGMLVGLQVPAVVDQYAKRVDAQLTEARTSLQGFERTAEAFFKGNIEQLIEHYSSSDDPVFRADANNLSFLYQRVLLLQQEQSELAGSSLARAVHVLFDHQADIMQQTLQHYTYAVMLSPDALIWGLLTGFLLAALAESLLLALWRLRKRKSPPAQNTA